MDSIRFTLYSRSYCHLCDDMLKALQALGVEHKFEVSVVDVDDDEALIAQYDELVPVLFGSKNNAPPERLCHYFLDMDRVKQFFRA